MRYEILGANIGFSAHDDHLLMTIHGCMACLGNINFGMGPKKSGAWCAGVAVAQVICNGEGNGT